MSRHALDLTGRTFGDWFVLSKDTTKKHKIFYRCQCKCGAVHSVRSDALLRRKSSSCKACSRKKDLSDCIFGNWFVISPVHQNNARSLWLCRCLKCGFIKAVDARNLTSGKSTQCRKCGTPRTHNQSRTRLYSIYRHMINRCYCKTCDCYSNYGGRGITICDEWRKDFSNFAKWALTNGYKENLTIDRINVDLGYSPNNCCWATLDQQQRMHKRGLVELTLNGVTKCQTEWSRLTGLSVDTIKKRLRRGWSVEKTLTTPPLTGKNAKTWKNPSL